MTESSAPPFPAVTHKASLTRTTEELLDLIRQYALTTDLRFGSDDLCFVYPEWNDKSNSSAIGAAFRMALREGIVERLSDQYKTRRHGGNGSIKNYYRSLIYSG